MFKFFLLLSNILIYMCLPGNTTDRRNASSMSLFEKFYQNDYNAIIERGVLVRYNKQYLRWFDIATFKYNRTTTAFNLTWTYKMGIGNNLDMVVQAYKFASNEYRLFPLRIQSNFCEAYKANIVGLHSTKHCGNFNGCPLRKNLNMTICNFLPDDKRLPPFVPTGRYMLEIQGIYRTTEIFFVDIYLTVDHSIPWQ